MRTELDGICEAKNGACPTDCDKLNEVNRLVGRELSSLIHFGLLEVDSYEWLVMGLVGLRNNFGKPGEHRCPIPPDERLCAQRMASGIKEIDRFRTRFRPTRYKSSSES